jgi:hypothetical protein
MSAFRNGAYFLFLEQYDSAEACYRAVTEDFPDCSEAQANLGYALLMQYCDRFDEVDLRNFKVGQLAVGGFYVRPKKLIPVLGIDRQLWQKAVDALEAARRQDPDLILAEANLGVAYLVSPDGIQADRALPLLEGAARRAGENGTLPAAARAAVLVNAGVANLADKRLQTAGMRLDQAVQALGGLGASQEPQALRSLSGALLYNRSLWLEASPDMGTRAAAGPVLRKYLGTTAPDSRWWNLAFERYERLTVQSGAKPEPREQLAQPSTARVRLLTALKVSAFALVLGESMADVEKALGKGTPVPVAGGKLLFRLRYPDRGLDLLATDQLLAICLNGPGAPQLSVQLSGPGSPTKHLSVGMAEKDLEDVLDGVGWDYQPLDDPAIVYRFYPSLGLAVLIQPQQGKVRELVIAQIPRGEE